MDKTVYIIYGKTIFATTFSTRSLYKLIIIIYDGYTTRNKYVCNMVFRVIKNLALLDRNLAYLIVYYVYLLLV